MKRFNVVATIELEVFAENADMAENEAYEQIVFGKGGFDCAEWKITEMGADTMKYYIGTVFEQHGEFECDHTILFATPKCPDAYLKLITQGWYDIEPNEDPDHEGVYWNDCMTYKAGTYSEIPKSVYDLLRTHTHLNSMGEESDE